MQSTDAALRAEIQRAEQATELLENPLLAEALTAYESEITETWKTSPQRDAEGRERLYLMLAAATHFRAYLKTTAETGKLAKVQLQQPNLLRRIFP